MVAVERNSERAEVGVEMGVEYEYFLLELRGVGLGSLWRRCCEWYIAPVVYFK